MHQKGFAHKNLRADAIIIQNGSPLIVPNLLMNYPEGAYYSFLVNRPEGYLSPAELISLKEFDAHPRHSAMKSDVFCLGLIMFQVCTTERIERLYNYKQLTVDIATLQR